jgi:hypothetical protein
MTKAVYVGINNVSHKIKNIYIGGGGNTAQKVKKGYIGINDIAKLFYESRLHGVYKVESNITPLSALRRDLAATTVGNYALFGGGYTSDHFDTVDAYNTSLTRSTPTVLSVARSSLAATSIGNYALFGGGTNRSINVVDAYTVV